MNLKDFWKAGVIKLLLFYALLFFGAWILGEHSPILPPPQEIGTVWLDDPSHGSGAYHDPYQYRLRI